MDSFEYGFGNWNDGGADCSISTSQSSSGIYSVKLKDDSAEASSIYSNLIKLEGTELVTLSFKYHCFSMEVNESFMLEISTDGGNTFKIIDQWVSGIDFENEKFYSETVPVNYKFSNSTVFRFRCEASSNNDHVYLDEIELTEGELNFGYQNLILTESLKPSKKESDSSIESIKIFPNPAKEYFSLDLSSIEGQYGNIEIYNLLGSKLSRTVFKEDHPRVMELPIDYLENGYYSVCIRTNKKKLHVMRLMVSR